MKYELKKISILQTCKVTAVIYIPFSLIYVFFGFLLLGSAKNPGENFLGVILILAPVWAVIMAFIFTGIGCLVYNFIAELIGGIEFELEEKQ